LEFRLDLRELGHTHRDRLADIHFPKCVRDEIVTAHEAVPHHILRNSGWVSVILRTDADVDRAIQLLEHSFLLAQVHCVATAERRQLKESIGNAVVWGLQSRHLRAQEIVDLGQQKISEAVTAGREALGKENLAGEVESS
jgi:Family of unknown function (DUF5519)